MPGDRAAIALGTVHGAAELVHYNEKVAAKKFHLGDVYDPLMVLLFATTATAVPDILPKGTRKQGSISMLLN